AALQRQCLGPGAGGGESAAEDECAGTRGVDRGAAGGSGKVQDTVAGFAGAGVGELSGRGGRAEVDGSGSHGYRRSEAACRAATGWPSCKPGVPGVALVTSPAIVTLFSLGGRIPVLAGSKVTVWTAAASRSPVLTSSSSRLFMVTPPVKVLAPLSNQVPAPLF